MTEQNEAPKPEGGPTRLSMVDPEVMHNFLEPEPRVFPEHLFVSVWLPIFAGKTDEINGKKVTISDWLDVSGTAFHEVAIINKEGKILFYVPPLIRDTPMATKRHSNDTMMELMAEYESYARLHPKMGKSFLDNVVSNKIPRKPADVRYIRRWNNIFAHYGYNQIELSPIAKQAMDAIERFEASKLQRAHESQAAVAGNTEIVYNDDDDSI